MAPVMRPVQEGPVSRPRAVYSIDQILGTQTKRRGESIAWKRFFCINNLLVFNKIWDFYVYQNIGQLKYRVFENISHDFYQEKWEWDG